MKTISTALAAHFAQPSTTTAMLWKVVRQDGFKFGFTDCDQAITFNDGTDTITYTPTDGVTGSATDTSSTDTSNQEIVGFLDSALITEEDILANLYDYAVVQIRIVNWADLTMGALLWKNATLGQVSIKNGQFTAELRGLEFWLTVNMGEEYGPQCRADLGDAQCTIDLSLWIQDSIVGVAVDRQTFEPGTDPSISALVMRGSSTPTEPAPAGWFVQGYLTWTSGLNNGYSMEITGWDGTTIALFENMPFSIQVGDTFTITPGCDSAIGTCFTKFDNVANHRGEPFIPGMDQITLYPNAGGDLPVS
jgi:uncharacterized phage protein (TIGR02218 family)